MMPFPEDKDRFAALFDDGDSEHLVVGYDAGDKNQYSKRVTTTMNLMRKIDTAIAYVMGENKREALTRMLNETGDTAETPARILKEIPGRVLLFTDIN
jgi:6-phosphogluconolactonase/glucosamine-6-phosphate isomerase/deaminase